MEMSGDDDDLMTCVYYNVSIGMYRESDAMNCF